MRVSATLANVVWGATSLPAWRAHRAALGDPAAAQRARLLACLRANATTEFGRAHGFAAIRSIDEYQQRVPICTYDDLVASIERVAAGESEVLTRDRVSRLVPSSGSTSAVKLVPHTRALQRDFSGAVDAWIADLFLTRPQLMAGRAYWSITPPRPIAAAVSARTAVPIGFDSDSRYLGGARHALARAVLVEPPRFGADRDLDTFRRATAAALTRERELRLISVWHPSFLLGLIDALDVTPSLAWPKLRLVSCWGDGPASAAAEELGRRLPGVEIQHKGLLATEGVVTIPFAGRHPIAIRSHFFEFVAPDGSVALAHELSRGVDYRVVITTGGGLYRYDLSDRVRVDGFVHATPSLRFIGKDDRISDRCGEKLSDGFVANALTALFAGRARPRFTMLAPDLTPAGLAYTLFVETDTPPDSALEADLERELRRNPHYAWCVDLGQLRPARIMRTSPGAAQAFVNRCVAGGQRLGDVKPVSLHTSAGWTEVLA